MRVLLASAEAVPFAKAGGLADVAGSLPGALRKLGIDARVMMPGYGFINHMAYGIEPLFSFDFHHRMGRNEVAVFSCVYEGTPFYFLQSGPYFGLEGGVYSDWHWDMERYVYFNQAMMAALWRMREEEGWFAELLHVNDWHTSLLPFLIRGHGLGGEWDAVGTVLSIHNIAYQGEHAGGFLYEAGIGAREAPKLAEYGLTDNLLGIGVAYSDMLSTVSPRYAEEIQHAYAGYGLAPLIASRRGDLRGILNGLDTELWDPAADDSLFVNFSAEDFVDRRAPNKGHLQGLAGLPVRDDVPLIGVVSRLAAQKGFDMALPALRQVMGEREVQLVALGSGESELEHGFWSLAQDYASQAAVFLQFDGGLAQQIYAGCDVFLMPSHYEPCGMGQMMAMRYGALPLVRETGGLADTVVNYDDGDADVGDGFVFQWQESDAVLGTLEWALDVYANRPGAWRRMQERAMRKDFSWEKSAVEYVEMYGQARVKRGGA